MHRETETLPEFTPKVDAKFVREYQEARRTELSPLRSGKFNIPTYSITLRERKKVTIKESVAASSVDMTTSVADQVEATSTAGTLRLRSFSIPSGSTTFQTSGTFHTQDLMVALYDSSGTSIHSATIRIIPSGGAYRVQVQFPESTEIAMRLVVVE